MRHVLPNGLTVLVQSNRAAPVVALQAWVNAGSADESDEESGLAHLHEHMLFKGTARRGLGEIARAVEAAGGDINAWTSFDQTVYHLVLASRFFETGLDILGDAVTASSFDKDELAREIEVVCEEIKRSYDSPARRASRDVFALAYAAHPYRRPVIGTPETVRSFTQARVLDFYRRHYRPDDIVLVIVGDVAEDEALRLASQSPLGRMPRPAQPIAKRPREGEPPQSQPRALSRADDLRETWLNVAWHVPGIAAADVPALDLLAVILGQGESSRLNLVVKRELALVNDIHASCFTPRDPGLMMVSATMKPPSLPAALSALLEQTYRARTELVSWDELATAQRLVESDAVYQRETVQGQSRKLGFFQSVTGGVEFEERYYEAIAACTPEDLRSAAERYLAGDAVTLVALQPAGDKPLAVGDAELLQLAADADRHARGVPRVTPQSSRPAREAPVKVLGSGETRPWHTEKLPGGGTLLVKQDRTVPLVALRAVWTGGLRAETEATSGSNYLLARLLTRGTRTLDAGQVARAIDGMAGGVSGNSGRNSFGLRLEALSKHFPAAFGLFADCLVEPALAPDELDKERRLQLEEIRSKDDNPAGVAFDLFAKTLYTTHPYRLDILGTEAALEAETPASLRAKLSGLYAPGAVTLAIAGDVDVDEVRRLALARFGGAATGSPAITSPPPEPPQSGPREAVRHLQREQAHLVVGFPGVTLSDPLRFPLEVLSAVLSGQGGRLFLELRDKKSLAYSVTSFSMEGLDPGYFAVYIGTSPHKIADARAGIRAELSRVTETRVTDDELARARMHLVGAHAIGLQKASSRAAVVAFDACYGLGYDASEQYEERIMAVTAADVLACAQRVLDFSRETVALVTP